MHGITTVKAGVGSKQIEGSTHVGHRHIVDRAEPGDLTCSADRLLAIASSSGALMEELLDDLDVRFTPEAPVPKSPDDFTTRFGVGVWLTHCVDEHRSVDQHPVQQ